MKRLRTYFFFIFFKIWEGILFMDARGASGEGQIPRAGEVVTRSGTTAIGIRQ